MSTLDQAINTAVRAEVAKELDRILGVREKSTQTGQILFKESEAAQMVGISPLTLRDMRLAGKVPCHRPRRPVLYSRANLDAIVEFLGKDE